MPNHIKAIIADVDGVMVGRREGVNFPLPHADVIKALRQVAGSGVPVVLCSAKFRTAIDGIIIRAKLANPHITDAGALIINPLGKPEVIEQNVIAKAIVNDYLSVIDDPNTELYTATACYMRSDGDPGYTRRRAKLLQTEPVIVDSLIDTAKTVDTIKLVNFAEDREDMPRVEARMKRFGSELSYVWSYHPRILPRLPLVVTAAGVSKRHAARKVAGLLGIGFDSILGIGDSQADWNFMQLCAYAATVGDDRILRQFVTSKGPKRYFHADSVNKHGLLAAFSYFGLT